MATDLKEIRFRLSEKELLRIEQLKKEFSFKSRSRLVRLLVTCSAEKLEDKIHVVPEEISKEIREAILAIARDVHDAKLNLQRMGNNINQIAKKVNETGRIVKEFNASELISEDEILVEDLGFSFEVNETYMRSMKKNIMESLSKYATAYESNDDLSMKTQMETIKLDCLNADEVLAKVRKKIDSKKASSNAAGQAQSSVGFEAEQIEKLIERLDKASEELGQLLWQIK